MQVRKLLRDKELRGRMLEDDVYECTTALDTIDAWVDNANSDVGAAAFEERLSTPHAVQSAATSHEVPWQCGHLNYPLLFPPQASCPAHHVTAESKDMCPSPLLNR